MGPYEILLSLGAGGMGEVYKARDTRLDRVVAIKVLPPEKTGDATRKLRFFQEARAASALNHPNIVTVYDVGSEDGVDYIVMEFVDGKTMDQLIPRGGMRVGEILGYGMQAADALAKAHAAGIVHRDLKPSNIMISRDGPVKVLDFGLAKFSRPTPSEDDATQTLKALTDEGAVVGTVYYMSPEQAEGKGVDARSDIFSFGAMLFEMATGLRPFTGDSKSAVLSSILRDEPKPPAALRSDLPPELSRIIMRCLRKDPARRFQHTADLKVALEELKEESDSGALGAVPKATPVPRRSRRFVWAAAGAVVLSMAAVAIWRTLSVSPPVPSTYTPVPITSYRGNQLSPSFSPDGSQIAFAWNGPEEDNFDIYVKLIGAGTPLRLTTNPAFDAFPRWSPDGRWIAFIRITEKIDSFSVIVVPALGGPERRIGTFHNNAREAFVPLESVCWTRDSQALIVSASESAGQPNRLVRVPLEGGEPKALTHPGPELVGDGRPALSSDGRELLFLRVGNSSSLFVLPLSAAMEPKGEPQRVEQHQPFVTEADWLPDTRDIVFASAANTTSTLFRISTGHGGPELAIAGTGSSAYSPTVSGRGNRLAYQTGAEDSNFWAVDLITRTASLDRGLSSSFRDVFPQFSPDGKRVAFYSSRSGTKQIWTANRDGSQAAALTSMAGPTTASPRWSPDGQQIVFDSDTGGTVHIYVIGADGGQPRQAAAGEGYSGSWSRDGRWIYFSSDRSGAQQVWKVPAAGGAPQQVTHGGGSGALESPDGKMLYYVKHEGNGGLWKMPAGGGEETKVVPDVYRFNYDVTDKGIYFTPHIGSNYTSSVEFLSFATGTITQLVKTKPPDLGLGVSPDGRTLLYSQVDQTSSNIMLVENFR
jgi:serine/threonine protein kinase